MSLEALGEDESETESFLQSLNPTRKNTLVKCNLQYVLSALDGLGEMDGFKESKGECKSESKHSDFYSESSKHNSSRRNRTSVSNSGATTKKNIFEENEKNFSQIKDNTSSGYDPGSELGTENERHNRSLRSLSVGDEKERDVDMDDSIAGNRSNTYRK